MPTYAYCARVSMPTHMHVCKREHAYVCIHVITCEHAYTYVCTREHAYTHTCAHVSMPTCAYT